MKPGKALLAASVLLGLELDNPLQGFIEETVEDSDEPAEYVFVGRDGRGRVTAKQLIEFRYCDPAITAATGEVVEHIVPAQWRKVRRALLAARTVEKLGPEAGVTGTTRARLLAELRDRTWGYSDDTTPDLVLQALQGGHPVLLDGRVWVSVEAMLDRLDAARVRYVRREIMRGLLALGCCEKRQEWYTPGSGGARTSRILYAVPQVVLDEAREKPKPQKP